VWPRLEIFLKDVLGAADGLKHRLLVGRNTVRGQSAKCSITVCLRWFEIVQLDRAAQPFGMEIRFRVRETPEWRLHAAELETEMLVRGMMFEVIDWSERPAARGMMG
jgi:hypothetical protein